MRTYSWPGWQIESRCCKASLIQRHNCVENPGPKFTRTRQFADFVHEVGALECPAVQVDVARVTWQSVWTSDVDHEFLTIPTYVQLEANPIPSASRLHDACILDYDYCDWSEQYVYIYIYIYCISFFLYSSLFYVLIENMRKHETHFSRNKASESTLQCLKHGFG